MVDDAPDFRIELCGLLNRWSRENGSNTPDFILRDFICDSLAAFDRAVVRREEWYGRVRGDFIAQIGDSEAEALT